MEMKGLSKVTQMVLELDWNPLCLRPRLCGSVLRSPAVLTSGLGTPPVSPGNHPSLLSALILPVSSRGSQRTFIFLFHFGLAV